MSNVEQGGNNNFSLSTSDNQTNGIVTLASMVQPQGEYNPTAIYTAGEEVIEKK